ncbi:O-antigen ligase [Dyadobacter sp. CY351]|uniref:O-antigen ligase family protein n=1 Tax=Dyadobacter sp. CY351 TaxID=2909337 RepID=UPI001F3DC55A|nr:O-antigen ligase family protein [Dyadobacter sp. CY351]MCF2520636.1 O-antigen ligase family protein [Dyadobacter sp. CY351]
MARLGIQAAMYWLAACMLVLTLGKLFEQLLLLGEDEMQTSLVLAFYIYCIISLLSASKHKLFHVLAIPVFTQFLHLFQKYAFTAGANSFWRLLPFGILSCYFAYFSLRKPISLTQGEKLFLFSWINIQAFFLLISPNFGYIISGGFLLYLIVLPSFFIYLKQVSTAIDFAENLELYLCALYIILGIGTFGLVVAGASYMGSDNLLATRNITDTNVTMAYFILLWPFVLLYASMRALNSLVRLALSAILLSVVVLSFSRGAVLLVIPYVILTSILAGNHFRFWHFLLLAFGIIGFVPDLLSQYHDSDMAYFWTLRFGDLLATDSLLDKLQEISGRAEIYETAYHLFLLKPLTGHGTGSFETLGPGYREAHSLFYTLLAENGMLGLVYFYGLFVSLLIQLISVCKMDRKLGLLLVSFIFYLIYNHTVGSVFVILPAKSVTINCLAPILLMCIYFYSQHAQKAHIGLADE